MTSSQSESEFDQLPPHNLEAEAACLGSIVREFDELGAREDIGTAHCLRDAMEYVDDPAMFYDLRHQLIFSVMLNLKADSKPLDVISLITILRRDGKEAACGGYPYVSELPDQSPAPIMARHFARGVPRRH